MALIPFKFRVNLNVNLDANQMSSWLTNRVNKNSDDERRRKLIYMAKERAAWLNSQLSAKSDAFLESGLQTQWVLFLSIYSILSTRQNSAAAISCSTPPAQDSFALTMKT